MLRRWLYVFATSYSLVFFSELLFWGTDSFPSLVETWIYYTLVTYIFLAAVAHFRVNSVWSLFLAGALYGWLTEGVLVQTLYENLPLSISNTGLSWHALISILIGWYAMRTALIAKRPYRALLLGLVIGVLWGTWISLWGYQHEPGVAPPTLGRMLLLTSAAVPGLALSYGAQNRLASHFAPHKVEIGVVTALLLVLFLFGAVPAYPLALVVLPALLLVLFLGFRRQKRNNPAGESFITSLSGRIPSQNYLGLLLMAPAALSSFAVESITGLTPLPQFAIHALIVPAGFALLILSLVKIHRKNKPIERV